MAVGKVAKLLITFKNPLPVEMEDVTLNIDVADMIDGMYVCNFELAWKYVLTATQ